MTNTFVIIDDIETAARETFLDFIKANGLVYDHERALRRNVQLFKRSSKVQPVIDLRSENVNDEEDDDSDAAIELKKQGKRTKKLPKLIPQSNKSNI